jgi:hypothetical protein
MERIETAKSAAAFAFHDIFQGLPALKTKHLTGGVRVAKPRARPPAGAAG